MNRHARRTAPLFLVLLLIAGCAGFPKTLDSSDVTMINSWIGLRGIGDQIVETQATSITLSKGQTVFHEAAFTMSYVDNDATYILPVSWKVYLNGKLISSPRARATSTGQAFTTSLDVQPHLFGSGQYKVELYVGDDNGLVATKSFKIR